MELGSSGHRISGNSSRYCRLRSTRPSTAPRGRGTGGQRADSHWPRDSAEGFFGLRRGWGDREKAKMGSVSVLVGRAAHPTSKQPCAVQRARPDPRPAPALPAAAAPPIAPICVMAPQTVAVQATSWRGVARLPWSSRCTAVATLSLRIPARPPLPPDAPRTVTGAPLTQAHFWRGGMCGLS